MDDVSSQGRMIVDMDADAEVVLKEATDVAADIVKDVQDADVKEITAASDTITAVTTTITATDAQVSAATLTTAPLRLTAALRRRKGVVIRDPEKSTTSSIIIPAKAKSKDKGKGILVEEPKPLKKQAQIKQDKAFAMELEAELNRNIHWDKVIDHVHKKAKKDPAGKIKAAKRKKLDEEVEELKRHLQIVPNKEDDAYTEATPLALKRRYPLTRFTLDQMFNNVRLEVKEESEVSLELLRFIRQQHQEGFQLEECLNTSSIKLKNKTKIKLVEQRRKLDV
nr:hypothetical protein [Tanacetum cinerariifolium]